MHGNSTVNVLEGWDRFLAGMNLHWAELHQQRISPISLEEEGGISQQEHPQQVLETACKEACGYKYFAILHLYSEWN